MTLSGRISRRDGAVGVPIRVLIVDDSAFMRFTIAKHLAETPDLMVVGAARDGEEALAMIPQLQPDVVTLDVEMPRMDGLVTLREIMASYPRPVIMLSHMTKEGAHETVQALTWGAIDFVAKPDAQANVGAIMEEVTAKIRRAAQARVRAFPKPRPGTSELSSRSSKKVRPFGPKDKVVVIGASTGGPRALTTLMAQLPAELPAALLIVQHMPPGFTRSLAERLDGLSSLAVREAAAGDRLQAGGGLVAPGGYHMTLDEDFHVVLNQSPPVLGVRPSVDVTMASVALRCGPAAIGVILTGMGHDGTSGATLIRNAGGAVLVEDESSCVVWGMPRSVVEAGVAHAVLPLAELAPAIVRAVRTGL